MEVVIVKKAIRPPADVFDVTWAGILIHLQCNVNVLRNILDQIVSRVPFAPHMDAVMLEWMVTGLASVMRDGRIPTIVSDV